MNNQSQHPAKFKFSIGGYLANCFELEWADPVLKYRQAQGAYMFEPRAELALTPTDEAWEEFWLAVEAAGVWQWNRKYDNNNVDDGVQWSLTINHLGKQLSCWGSNAYPGGHDTSYSKKSAFGQFIQALKKLTGQKKIR